MNPIGLDLRALERYLTAHVCALAGELTAELLTGGRSNLTYVVTDGARRWVLRRPPLGTLTPTAHDMGREYRVVAALGGTGVPVAEAVALCEDPDVLGVPFSIVSYVDGQVVGDAARARALTAADAHRCADALVDALAQLHDVSYADIGLAEFGRPRGYLRRQVRRWMGQWERVATRELPALNELHERLAADVPEESRATIVHGDFRLDNVILAADDPGRVAAIVDWEMATLGDPLADLGLLLVYWDPACAPVLGETHAPSANPGFGGPARLVERYAKNAPAPLDRLDFYRALGYFKLAVIAEGIHARFLAGQTVGDGFDGIGKAVPVLVEAGLRYC